MKPCIIMRANNDLPIITETLQMLARQDHPFRLIAFDNESTDGTLEELRKYTDRIHHVDHYVTGEVLNAGMENSEGEIVVFLNSDCTPQDDGWLSSLLSGFTSERVGAVFGRQIPRPDCRPLYAKDTEDTYGDGSRHQYFRNSFSMASSAIRRSVWEEIRFDENLQIAEDIDWTWRARKAGFTVNYVPESAVMHSHNYSISQFYRRHFKEGRDDALIFDWTAWHRSILRYSILPYGRQVLSDVRHCLPRLALGAAAWSPFLRMMQMVARRGGFSRGWKERATREKSEPVNRESLRTA